MTSRDSFWTSAFNELEEIRRPYAGLGPVHFYDTTLRDGEQTVGTVFSPDEKVAIARLLDRLGVDRIEAGFPRVSGADREAFQRILEAGLKAQIWGFSRALPGDLDELINLGVRHAVVEVPTSRIKIEAYGLSREKVISRAIEACRYASENKIHVAFFAVDCTRSDLGFLKEIYQAALDAGAREAVVVDTIGACSPEAVEWLVQKFREWLGPEVPLHFHGHDDFGLATASAVAAVRGGATWIQGTINGMGERAGNADLAEVALALEGLYGISAALNLEVVRQVSAEVQKAGGYAVDAWKPVVGKNLFVRESGAVAAQFHLPSAIEPYSSELVGAQRQIVLGKKSGLANIRLKAEQLGLTLPEDRLDRVLSKVKDAGVAKKRLLTDEEFRQIVGETTA